MCTILNFDGGAPLLTDSKPSHLSGEYGAWFKDRLLAAAYPARPSYPDGVIQLLTELIQDTPRVVLDVGCGTGELTRRLSPFVERIDAVDFSEAMLQLARRLPHGDAVNIRWTLGAAEDVALNGPFALAMAGESLHWMNLDVVMSCFAQALTRNGMVAIIDRNWDTNPSVWQRILPVIERHTPIQNYQAYDLVADLVRRELFEVHGQQRFGPAPWRPTIDEYLECRHSQRGLSRTHMGPAAVASFDTEVRQVLRELSQSGVVAHQENRLEFSVVARVTWGRPPPCSALSTCTP